MAKTNRFIARCTDEERAALQALAGDVPESKVIRELVREGLSKRGLWPPQSTAERRRRRDAVPAAM